MVTRDYGLKPVKPTLMAEAAYESGSEYGFEVTPLWVRRQAYYSYLAGGHHTYGHNDSWRILPTWKRALDAPGARQMGVLRKIFEARAEWWLLVPDQSLLTSGGRTEGKVLRLAARHRDGRWAMVYLADGAVFSVDLTKLAGPAITAFWVDPKTGKPLATGTCANEGTRSFSTPDGWDDALLILETAGSGKEDGVRSAGSGGGDTVRSGGYTLDAASNPPADAETLQAALDTGEDRLITLADREYTLQATIVIRRDGSGLRGPARLVQRNPDAPVIRVRNARDVTLRDLTLTRPAGTRNARAPAIEAEGSSGLSLERISVTGNRSQAAAIRLDRCEQSEIVRCRVQNYMTLGVDDRTSSPHYGYAFNCIDGTGIGASRCRGLLLEGNRIIELEYRPAEDLKRRHRLGEFIKRAPGRGTLVNEATWKAGYVNNWHQGSAIAVTSPEVSAGIRIVNNHIENAAQGVDIHADHVVMSGNVVINAFVGMKAMHGSRHVLIIGNQFIRNDLWAVGLMPGTASHAGIAGDKGTGARPPNVDGGSIIANNIVSDFGHGDAHWMWTDATRAPMRFDRGQERHDPPLHDVIITGNVIYDASRADVTAQSAARAEPRYDYAVLVEGGPSAPQRLHFSDNIFHAGTRGVSNVPLRK
jgi:hypothetical protein